MSMNLIFNVKGGAGCVDFPFQTPTSLTYQVLAAESKQKQLQVIYDYIDKWEDIGFGKAIKKEVADLFDNPNLELSII